MLCDLLLKLYDGDAGIAGNGPNPGASARNRYSEFSYETHSDAKRRQL